LITDRHTYLFELHAAAKGTPLYHVSFTYPPAPTPNTAAPDNQPRPRNRPSMPRLNFAWKRTGDRAVARACVRRWHIGLSVLAAGRDLPAVLASDGKTEGPVNYAMRDGLIVVDGLPCA
jgi:type IV secretion system protein VirB9